MENKKHVQYMINQFGLGFICVVLLCVSQGYGGQWVVPVDLPNNVQAHTATLLPNGLILIAGGQGPTKVYCDAWLYDARIGSYSATGDMTQPRFCHTATLLPDGNVLIVGGMGNAGKPCRAITIYHTRLKEFKTVAQLNHPRLNHAAVLLPDGKVLIIGDTKEIEVYDPKTKSCKVLGKTPALLHRPTATLLSDKTILLVNGKKRLVYRYTYLTNTFKKIKRLHYKRDHHTATFLPNGQVLILGGAQKAEIFCPQKNTLIKSAALTKMRVHHTATLLPDGKVMVVGGGLEQKGTSVEVYDYVLKSFQEVDSMKHGRSKHSATMLPDGSVFVYGGGEGVGAEVFQPSAGKFYTTKLLEKSRNTHTATLLPSGQVLVVGGYNGAYLKFCELFDPVTNQFIKTGNLSVPRHCHSATLLPDGNILIAGGYGDEKYWASAELYQITTRIFTKIGNMTSKREKHTATILPSGDVLMTGGFNSRHLSSAEVYDVKGRTFYPVGSMAYAREKHSATLLRDGKILITGGYDGKQYLKAAEIYAPKKRKFKTSGNMLQPRRIHTATLLPSGKVLIVGGINKNGFLRSAEIYDPEIGFAKTGNLNKARNGHTATLLPNGKVMIAGGGVTDVELYHPDTGEFAYTPSMTIKRREHSATLLTTGEVLIIGGEDGFKYLNSAERARYTEYVYKYGVQSCQPKITTCTANVFPGKPCIIKGEKFCGPWGAGDGQGTGNSAVNYPRVYLRAVGSGGMSAYGPSGYQMDVTELLFPMDWTQAQNCLVFSMPDITPGYWLVTVVCNGISSEAKLLWNKRTQIILPAPGPVTNLSSSILKRTVPTTEGWVENFAGPTGNQPSQWLDESDDWGANAELNYSCQTGYAAMTRTADSDWGRVQTQWIRCDVSTYNYIEAKTISVSPGAKWNIALVERGTNKCYDLVSGSTNYGTREADFQKQTGWQGTKEFSIRINMEGTEGQYIILDSVRVFRVNQ